MNTALDFKNLDGELCVCNAADFEAKLTYEADATAKTVIVTDHSVFGDGDGLKVVNVRVYDKDGKKESGQIEIAGGNVTIDVSDLNLSSIDITATIVSNKNKTADLGIYNIGSVALSGNLGYTKQ